MTERVQIGRNLRHLREQAGMSRREIGHFLDVSGQQVQKYENGTDRLSVDNLFWLHHLYRVPYECFFAGLTAEEESCGKPPAPKDVLALEIYLKISKLKSRPLRRKIRDIVYILAR